MSMQNHLKILAQLKDYLHKSGYNKTLQIILFREWLVDFLQKVTYSRINALKKRFSTTEFLKSTPANNQLKVLSVNNGRQLNRNETATAAEKVTFMSGKDETLSSKSCVDEIPSIKQEKQVRETASNCNVDQQQDAAVGKMVVEPAKAKSHAAHLQTFLDTLMLKLTTVKSSKPTKMMVVPPPSSPKWKVNVRENIPMHSIASRTRHVLNSIATAESSASRWRRIEDFLTHIDQYPEARHYAIKEGAIKVLLKTRQKAKDKQIIASAREALAILGYTDPLPAKGIRILSIDGGGMRGVLVIEMLKKLEELTGKKTYEMFDYICGVSTGAILAATLGGHKRMSLNEISELYKELSTKVFTQSAIKGTSNLVWSHGYYDTALWEKLLQEHLGDKTLIKIARDPAAPKFSAISAIVNHARVMAYVFRNYTLPYRVESQYIGSHKHKLWEAVRASAAAPSYFEEFKHGEYLHQDGGIFVNNPCAVALHEAKQLWPNNPIQCVVSFGTGRTPNRIYENNNNESMDVVVSSWKDKFYKILDSATDTEAVHTMLNDLLPEHVYFRFNPYLTEMLSMVEIRPEKISQLEQDAKMYIRRNEEKFQKAAEVLSEKRRIRQKILDWIILQKQIYGL